MFLIYLKDRKIELKPLSFKQDLEENEKWVLGLPVAKNGFSADQHKFFFVFSAKIMQ